MNNKQLIKAIKNGSIEDVQYWIANGADIHYWNEQPLGWALIGKFKEAAELFLSMGADASKLRLNTERDIAMVKFLK